MALILMILYIVLAAGECGSISTPRPTRVLSTKALLPTNGFNITVICIWSEIPLKTCNCVDKPRLCGPVPTQSQKVLLSTASMKEICDTYYPMEREMCNCTNPLFKQYEVCDKKSRYTTTCPSHKKTISIASLTGAIFGVFGNGLVLLVAHKNWEKAKNCQKLIGVLALSDFVFSIINIIHLAPYLKTCDWIYGDLGCKIINSCLSMSSTISISLILLITCERFAGVVYPFSRGLSKRKIYIGLMIIMFISLAFAAPIAYKKIYHPIPKRCMNDSQKFNKQAETYFSLLIFFVTFFTPLLAIVFMYGKIIYKLWKGNNKDLGDQHHQQRQKDNKRIVIILITVTTCFFILVPPNYIFFLILNHAHIMSHLDSVEHWMRWQIYVEIPITLHTTINPILYSVVDHKFRKSLLDLICRKRRSKNEENITLEHQRDGKNTTTGSSLSKTKSAC
ncbi:neuropeptide Y receptor type 6-like [Clytia hemisphaerica]|uniref:neuropeptide Y receptor type 6-like n=1 Tax=Clytia hemisphaerica TaxID=252671 RepID=UPI0034D56EF9